MVRNKTYEVTAEDIAECLAWALGNVPEKIETPAGFGCKYCDGRAKDGGFITSTVSHTDDCPYRRAHLILDLFKIQQLRQNQKRTDEGCVP